MPITKTFNNTSYSIPLEGELNWATLSSFLVALADYSQTINKQKVGMRVAIATPVTVLATTDCVIVTDLTTPGAVAVNLPAGVSGQVFTVVDGKGDAGTNNITITPAAGTINGAATYVIDSNRAGVSLAYNGTSWTVIAEFISAGDIPRNQIASGTASHVVINDGSGDLSSEAQLAASRGGLATDASAFSGYVKSAAGVFSAGSIAAGDLPSSIDATKIADGSVTNTEFQYINSLTSNAQTQISDRVVGAASSTDNAVARFDLATGKIVQNSGIIVDDSNNVTGVNDLTVTGDLTVNGATVTVNTATLDVEDTNITVNKGGNDASSAGAGLTVDRTGTKGSIIYNNAAVSKFKVGDLASEVEIATISGAQVITNKDIDGGTASNTTRITIPKASKATLDALTRKEATIVYASDLDKLYSDDGTSLKEIGSGGSGINYLADYYTADTVGTVGNANVSDTGNRSSGTFSSWQSTNTTNISLGVSATSPLRALNCYLFTGSGNNASGTTFVESPAFQLNVMDLGKPVTVSFDIGDVTADGNFDVCMVRYNSSGTYQEKISIAGNASGATPASAKLPTGVMNFNGFFISSSTSTDYYALRFRRLAGTDVPRLDSVKISPDSVIQGAAITDWQSYTPTGAWVSNTTYTGLWRRVGDTMECQVKVLTSGAPTSANLYVTIPSGCTIDTTKITDTGAPFYICGIGGVNDSYSIAYKLAVGYRDTSSVYAVYQNNASGAVGYVTQVAPITFGASDYVDISFTVPISGWSSSVTMANRAVEEYASNSSTTDADDTTSFADRLSGSTFPGALTTLRRKRVRFQTPIQATDSLILEIRSSSTDVWSAVGNGSTGGIHPIFYQGGASASSTYGIAIDNTSINGTDVDVAFGHYVTTTGATYASAGNNWATGDGFWRVRKVSGGASVGFPVSARNIVGDVSGTAVPSGYIGESLLHIPSAITGTGSYAQWATLSLPAGKWLIIGTLMTDGSAGGNYIDACINTVTASISGTTAGYDRLFIGVNSTVGVGGSSFSIIKNTNVTTPLFLNGKTDHTSVGGILVSFQAIRIA